MPSLANHRQTLATLHKRAGLPSDMRYIRLTGLRAYGGSGGGPRQEEREAATSTFCALHLDPAAQRGRDMFHDAEAQPGPAEGAGAGPVDAVESLEDPRQMLRRDPDPCVRHGQGDEIPLLASVDRNR